jgi:hypothetical protein
MDCEGSVQGCVFPSRGVYLVGVQVQGVFTS